MTEKPIKIKLIGKVSYEDDLSVAQAAQVIAFLNEPVGSSTTIGTTLSPVQHTAGTPRDGEARVANPRDALELSGARTGPCSRELERVAWVCNSGFSVARRSSRVLHRRQRGAYCRTRTHWLIEESNDLRGLRDAEIIFIRYLADELDLDRFLSHSYECTTSLRYVAIGIPCVLHEGRHGFAALLRPHI